MTAGLERKVMTSTETDVAVAENEKPELKVDVKVEVKSTCERHVVVTIPRAEVDRYYKQTFDEISPKAELPGFRAGKAPRKLVESRFKEQVAEQVKSSLVMDSLQLVTGGDYFSAIGEPDFEYESVDLPESGDFVYEFRIEVRPEFDTPKWEGLALERPVCDIDDKRVDQQLTQTLSRFTSGEAVDGGCELEDQGVLHATFTLDGKQVASFEEESVRVRPKLSFGDAQIDGFGKLISGKVEGDQFSTTVKISDSAANETLRGKEVEANFQIVEIRRITIEDVGAQTLESLGFETAEELRGFVRTELEKQFSYHQQQALRKQVVAILTAGANWELPESLIRSQTNREMQRLVLELQRSGFPQDQITSYVNIARRNARESTIAALREHFVLEKIAEDMQLEPSPQDYDKELELIAEQSDSTVRKIRARLEKTGQMDAVRNQIVERMVIEKIAAAAKLTDIKDEDFFTQKRNESDIDFTISGDIADIPDAKHDNEPPVVPGAAKLPEADKSE
ncbi:MAG TPA: trigger factor [Planctomycetaceae bacterium]|nr:trigger factor [Planctomycetaceae bacterium]